MTNIFQLLTNSIKHWYIPLIIGIIFTFCGGYVFSVPSESYLTLTVLFSVSFIVSGLMEIFFAVQNTNSVRGWGWYLVDGLLTLAIGIYLVANPEVPVAILPYIVGFTALFRSFQLLGFSFDLKDAKIPNWGSVALTSVLGIIISLLLIANPAIAGMSLVTLTALSIIFIGVSSIMLGLSLKKFKDYPNKLSAELKGRIQNLQNEINTIHAKG